MSERGTKERLEVRRVIDAPAPEVFAAWTDAAGMAEWMRPGPTVRAECALDVRVGGRYTIRMFGADGEVFEHEGEYRVVDPPRQLAFTWISKGTQGEETLVTVELHARGEKTELVLVHEGLPAGASEPHRGGWTSIAEKLAAHVERRGASHVGER